MLLETFFSLNNFGNITSNALGYNTMISSGDANSLRQCILCSPFVRLPIVTPKYYCEVRPKKHSKCSGYTVQP